MVENFPNFIQDTNLKIQETEQIPNKNNSKKTNTHFWKLNKQKKSLKSSQKYILYKLIKKKKTNSKDCGFLIWNQEDQKQVAQYFSSAERKELST